MNCSQKCQHRRKNWRIDGVGCFDAACQCHTAPSTEEAWEKEFEKGGKFEDAGAFCGCMEGDLYDRWPDAKVQLIDFIQTEVSKARFGGLASVRRWAEAQRRIHTQLAQEIVGNPDWHLAQVEQANSLLAFLNV